MFRNCILSVVFVCLLVFVVAGCTVAPASSGDRAASTDDQLNNNQSGDQGEGNDNSSQPVPGEDDGKDEEPAVDNDNDSGDGEGSDDDATSNDNKVDGDQDEDADDDNTNDNSGADDTDDTDNSGIVPLTGIPAITLNVTTLSQGQTSLGGSTLTGNEFDGETLINQDAGITVLFNDNNIAIQIRLQAPYAGRTAGGNGIGNSWASFQSEFGTADATDGDWLIWNSKGIAIHKDANGNIDTIELNLAS